MFFGQVARPEICEALGITAESWRHSLKRNKPDVDSCEPGFVRTLRLHALRSDFPPIAAGSTITTRAGE